MSPTGHPRDTFTLHDVTRCCTSLFQSVITVAYRRTPTVKPYVKYAFRCVAERAHNVTANSYTYITHASHGW